MRKSAYGARIAHGALMVGYMSPPTETDVSLGYDRVRFLGAVYFGDTITFNYTVTEIDEERPRSSSTIKVVNQKGDVVSIATHILKWVLNPK